MAGRLEGLRIGLARYPRCTGLLRRVRIASSPAYPRGNPFGPTTVRSALVGSLGSSILTPCLSQYSTIRRAHRTLCRSISSMVSASLIVHRHPFDFAPVAGANLTIVLPGLS